MLHIKCDHCGTDLKGIDIIVTPFDAYFDGVKYKDYTTTCSKCGGAVVYDKYVKMREKNKAKAIVKLAKKKGKSIAKINEEAQYSAIMRKVVNQAIIPPAHLPRYKDVDKLIKNLPKDEKQIILEYEDKQDMAIMNAKHHKPTNQIKVKSALLFTQGIIEVAIADKDEDFFMSNYGKHIVDTYNVALTLHTQHDYEITAELLLEKMRKGTIKFDTEEIRRTI